MHIYTIADIKSLHKIKGTLPFVTFVMLWFSVFVLHFLTLKIDLMSFI